MKNLHYLPAIALGNTAVIAVFVVCYVGTCLKWAYQRAQAFDWGTFVIAFLCILACTGTASVLVLALWLSRPGQ